MSLLFKIAALLFFWFNLSHSVVNMYYTLKIQGGVSGGKKFLNCASPSSNNLNLLTEDDGSGRQKWDVYLASTISGVKRYAIKNAGGRASNRRFLSVQTSGQVVDLWHSEDGSGRQQWELVSLGSDTYQVKATRGRTDSYYTFLSVTSNGNKVDLWHTDDGSGRQRWVLEQIAAISFYLQLETWYYRYAKLDSSTGHMKWVPQSESPGTCFWETLYYYGPGDYRTRYAEYNKQDDTPSYLVMTAVSNPANTYRAIGAETLPSNKNMSEFKFDGFSMYHFVNNNNGRSYISTYDDFDLWESVHSRAWIDGDLHNMYYPYCSSYPIKRDSEEIQNGTNSNSIIYH